MAPTQKNIILYTCQADLETYPLMIALDFSTVGLLKIKHQCYNREQTLRVGVWISLKQISYH